MVPDNIREPVLNLQLRKNHRKKQEEAANPAPLIRLYLNDRGALEMFYLLVSFTYLLTYV